MGTLLRKFSRSNAAYSLTAFVFSKMNRWLPVKRVAENDHWLAFFHPKPGYPIHIVFVPKCKIKNWMAFPLDNSLLLIDFVELTQSVIRDWNLEEKEYRLIINGGLNQTFPHMHAHLVSGNIY